MDSTWTRKFPLSLSMTSAVLHWCVTLLYQPHEVHVCRKSYPSDTRRLLTRYRYSGGLVAWRTSTQSVVRQQMLVPHWSWRLDDVGLLEVHSIGQLCNSVSVTMERTSRDAPVSLPALLGEEVLLLARLSWTASKETDRGFYWWFVVGVYSTLPC